MIKNALAELDTDSIYSVSELANLLGIAPRAIRFTNLRDWYRLAEPVQQGFITIAIVAACR